jgi:diguanylate cyclase (GGDEF)-like protein
VFLFTGEVVLHSAASVYFVGFDSGFQLYLMGAVPFAVYNEGMRDRSLVFEAIGLCAEFVLLFWLGSADGIAALPEATQRGLFSMNAAITFAAIGTLSFFFRRASQDVERHVAQLAMTDALTQLPNRRAALRQLSREVSRVNDGDWSFVAALADVDHFKRVNDDHGHDAGDAVLKSVANTLRTCLRKTDLVARWGGEEFLVLLPGVAPEEGRNILEKLRQTVASSACLVGDSELFVTVTLGAAAGSPGASTEDILKQADEALYAGKKAGRDQVSMRPGA